MLDMLYKLDIRTGGENLEVACFIYGLKDPRTDRVRYVGQSIRPFQRFKVHMDELGLSPNAPKNNWLRELHALGLKPSMVILETTSLSKAGYREMVWIDKFKGPESVNFHKHGVLSKKSTYPYKEFLENHFMTIEQAANLYGADLGFFKMVFSKVGLLYFIEDDPNQLFASTLQMDRYNTALKAGLFELRHLWK